MFTKTAGTAYAVQGTNNPGGASVNKTWTHIEFAYNSPHAVPSAGFAFYRMASYITEGGSTNYHTRLREDGWTLNAAENEWQIDHVWRFRRLGNAWTQHGKHYALHFTPLVPRLTTSRYPNEQAGENGADYGDLPCFGSATPVSILRRVETSELSSRVNPGGRFLSMGQVSNIDGLVAFHTHKTSDWYNTHRTRGTAMGETPNGSVVTTVGLGAEHQILLADAVNQLKMDDELNPRGLLGWKALRFVHGSRVVDFSHFTRWDEAHWTGAGGMFGSQTIQQDRLWIPAPADAFIPVWDPSGAANEAPINLHWLAARGCPVMSPVDGLPASVATFKNQDTLQRSITINGRALVGNASYGGTFIVTESGEPWRFLQFNADITLEYTGHSVGAETAVAGLRGIAQIPKVPVTTNIQADNLVNINTAWSSDMRWIRTADFQSLVESFGFTFFAADIYVPLQLDNFIAGSDFELNINQGAPATQQNKRVCAYEFAAGTAAVPATHAQVLGTIEAINRRAELTGVDTVAVAVPYFSRQIGFRLTNEGETPEFKLPSIKTEPPTVYHLDNREEGRLRFSAVLAFGWQGICRHEVSFSTPPTNTQIVNFNVKTGLATDVRGWYFAPHGRAFQTVAPYGPAVNSTFDVPLPNSSQPTFNTPSCQSYGHELDAIITLDLSVSTAQDTLGAHVNGERKWLACDIAASASLTPSQEFVLFPVPHWKTEKDWWLGDNDSYMQSLLGGVSAQNTANGQDVARPTPAWSLNSAIKKPEYSETVTPAEVISAGAGLTLLKPSVGQMLKVIYDPF